MNPNIKKAITEIKAGNKKAGQALLMNVLRSDPGNERAWLWLSVTFDDLEKRKKALKKALQINPYNETAKRQLDKIAQPPKPRSRKTQEFKSEPLQKKSNLGKWLLAITGMLLLSCCGLYYLGSFLTSSVTDLPSTLEAPEAIDDNRAVPEDFVEILSDWTCHSDSIGNMIFTGRIRNEHDERTLASVRLRVAVEDARGNIVNTRDGYIDSDIVFPGTTSSFTIYVDNPTGATSCVIGVENARFER